MIMIDVLPTVPNVSIKPLQTSSLRTTEVYVFVFHLTVVVHWTEAIVERIILSHSINVSAQFRRQRSGVGIEH